MTTTLQSLPMTTAAVTLSRTTTTHQTTPPSPATTETLRSGPYPARWELADGTTLFVDLTEEGELAPYAHLLPEGARHVRMPIADFDVPTEEEMVEILDVIDGALADGEAVYVHCRAGIGRTRTVIGCHRRRHGRLPGREPQTRAQRELVRTWPEGR